MKTILGLSLAAWLGLVGSKPATPAEDQSFHARIAPVLEQRCVHCHGDRSPKGNLSLTTAAAALAGGDGGPAIVPGKPDESLLLEMIAGDPPEMPRKDKPLSPQQVADIRKWIEQGAAWPAGLVLKDARSRGPEVVGIRTARAAHGTSVRRADWGRNPIDAIRPGRAREPRARAQPRRPTAAP